MVLRLMKKKRDLIPIQIFHFLVNKMVEGVVDQIVAEIKVHFFNSRGRGFAPANQAPTQYGHGFTHGTNWSSGPFHNNNTIGQSVQQKGHPTQSNSSRLNPQQFHSNSTPQCQICGRTGHITVKCWYRYDYSFDTNENLTQVFVATMVSDPHDSGPNWYTNTEANSHMTSDPGNLDDP
jgi:hypothetical protein